MKLLATLVGIHTAVLLLTGIVHFSSPLARAGEADTVASRAMFSHVSANTFSFWTAW